MSDNTTIGTGPLPEAPGRVIGTTGMLAEALGAVLEGPAELPLTGVSGIDEAGPTELTFVRSAKYASRWSDSKAAAAVVSAGIEIPAWDQGRRAIIRVADADLAMIALLELVASSDPRNAVPPPGVHPSAAVDPSVTIPDSATIGPMCSIGRGAVIGEGVVLDARVSVAGGVIVGDGTRVHAGVVLMPQSHIGRRCILHPGVVIGAEGFGYRPDPSGSGLVRIPHIAGVTIGDDVEIGVNTAVDRGKLADTTIGDGTKIDNLVQVGHSCRIGRCVIICGHTAIGGSTSIGDGCVLGGACAVADNVNISAGAQFAGASHILGDIEGVGPWAGYPARPAAQTKRSFVLISRVERLRNKLHELNARITRLEKTS